jgi:hypothetical protein
MSARPLTLAGNDVGLNARSADGRVRIIHLDRTGAPTKATAWCWPHELRGVGWHLAEIKKAVSALPLIAAPAD